MKRKFSGDLETWESAVLVAVGSASRRTCNRQVSAEGIKTGDKGNASTEGVCVEGGGMGAEGVNTAGNEGKEGTTRGIKKVQIHCGTLNDIYVMD